MGHFLVTGAFSGLGLALSEEIVARGMTVSGIGRSISKRDPNTLKIFSSVYEMDLSAPSATEVHKVISELCATYPDSQLIINAAQIEPLGPLGSLKNSDIEESLNVNITSALFILNSFLDSTHSANSIYVIGSGAANHTIEGWDIYSIGKSALLRAIQFINATSPRTAQWLEPGVIDTHMQKRLRSSNWGLSPIELPSPAYVSSELVNQMFSGSN
jgi:NADP-dependent 3-hydroxy acid dehydrogenase YdfG